MNEILDEGRVCHVAFAVDGQPYAIPTIHARIEASAKIRSGDPVDDEVDHTLDYWAGVIPIVSTLGSPAPAADLRPGLDVPAYILDLHSESTA